MRALCAVIAYVIFIALAAAALAAEVSPVELENRRCLNCHGQSQMATMAANDRAVMVQATPSTRPAQEIRPNLYVPGTLLSSSVHAKIGCTDCHRDAKGGLPHKQHMTPVSCDSAGCHEKARSDYVQGAHAEAVARNDPNAPTCVSCHGAHDIFPKTDRNSRIHPLNIVKVCGDCHAKHQAPANGLDGHQHIQNYLDSVHGKALTKGGLAVAATCADCHSNHKVLPAKQSGSSVSRDNVANTCGRCHMGVSDAFATSIHGERIAKGDKDAPVCNDCHTAHQISRTDTPAFMLDIVNECGHCHNKPMAGKTAGRTLYESYRDSYHGQVTRLGMERSARCSSCHGAHNVKKVDASESPLNERNRIEVCRRCHPGADAKFASYQAHADPDDFHRSPALFGVKWYFIIMMSAAFGFFGLHSVLWFARSAYNRVRHGPHPKFNHHGPSIKRFNRVDRVNHAFVIISFFGLTITGLPLLYADKAWGRDLAEMLGGPKAAGIEHRIFAIMLIMNFVVHGFGILNRVRKFGFKNVFWGPNSMLPRWKDLKDCLGMWKWFFVGGAKPKFDRWTYWEKFDYIAEVGGSGIIGLTGLMLWFKVGFSPYMPGWMFNVAQFIHGYEALLAIGFIFTIHFFNAHLRLEKFPVDDVMFTGCLPEDEFKHERPAEYERLLATGQIEARRVKPASHRYRIFAVIAGISAMAVGTTLVVLIILAGLQLV